MESMRRRSLLATTRVAAIAALAAGGVSAKLVEQDVAKELASDAIERRHNLAQQHQKGNEGGHRTKKKVLTEEQSQGIQSRMLKRNRTSGRGTSKIRTAESDMESRTKVRDSRGDRGGKHGGESEEGATNLIGFRMGGAGKGGKEDAPAKAPSNGGTPASSPSSPSPRSKGGKESGGKSGKSRDLSSGICTKRLSIAYKEMQRLGPDSPFGEINSPSDVTDLCSFFPPEDEDDDPNFGCPLLWLPDVGFLEGEEQYVENFGEDPGIAFNALQLYCECYQGYDLGCAAKIPHGPPASKVTYGEEEVMVNGFSEYIPFSTPGDRAEYCKMVGVWNGDFDPDVAEDFTEDVEDCGCYFISQAKDMVDQCPGVELGAFFVFPDGMSPAPTPVDTEESPAPTPIDSLICPEDATYCEDFEEGDLGDEWSFETADVTLEPTLGWLSSTSEINISELLRGVLDKRVRRLDGGVDGKGTPRMLQGDYPTWEITDEEAQNGENSLASPDLSDAENAYISANATLSGGSNPGTLTFSILTEFNNSDDLFNGVAWFANGEVVDFVHEAMDWTTYEIKLTGEGPHEIIWEYVHITNGTEVAKPVYLDDVYFIPKGDGVPTYAPTYFPTFFPTEE